MQPGKSRKNGLSFKIFFISVVVNRLLRMVICCHSTGLNVMFLMRWFVLWINMRCLNGKYCMIFSITSEGMSIMLILFDCGVSVIDVLSSHLALYLTSFLGVVVSAGLFRLRF